MRYKETDWYELNSCDEVYGYTNHKDEDCEGCMEVYDQLMEDVNEEFVPTYEKKGYRIMDIYESDYLEHFNSKQIKFCLVLKKGLSLW